MADFLSGLAAASGFNNRVQQDRATRSAIEREMRIQAAREALQRRGLEQQETQFGITRGDNQRKFQATEQNKLKIAEDKEYGEQNRAAAAALDKFYGDLHNMRGMPREYIKGRADALVGAFPGLAGKITYPGLPISPAEPAVPQSDGTVQPSVPAFSVPDLPPSDAELARQDATSRAETARKAAAKKAATDRLSKMLADSTSARTEIAQGSVTGVDAHAGRAKMSTQMQAMQAIAYNRALELAAKDAGIRLDPAQLLTVPGTKRGDGTFSPQFPLPASQTASLANGATQIADRAANRALTRRGQNINNANAAASRAVTRRGQDISDENADASRKTGVAQKNADRKASISKENRARYDALQKMRFEYDTKAGEIQQKIASTTDGAELNLLRGRHLAIKASIVGIDQQMRQLKSDTAATKTISVPGKNGKTVTATTGNPFKILKVE